ncbi:MAG: M48 family metallopeptidase [Chloroflexi bacterium]|nr:M48 family metallopeptidase [Chloroflexota bacterium]
MRDPRPTPTQTFFAQQAANRRLSWLLMVSVVLLLALLGSAIGFGLTGDPIGSLAVTVGAVVLGTLLALGSYYGGDQLVLRASRARLVTAADAPQLFNVVEELTLAAGIPAPSVYLIDDTALNAFATGRDPAHASIAVTTGLLHQLDREELSGVIAHELSHVRNFDIRFALLVGVLVGSIALLADMFLRYSFFFGGGRRSRDNRGGGGGAQAIVAVLAVVLALLAPFVARIVQLSISRQREYLADASGVELTRNPVGLERALAKIATDAEVLEVANRATNHLYIVNPVKKFEARSRGLFSTHPPIVDRVNRLRALRGAPPIAGDTAGALMELG